LVIVKPETLIGWHGKGFKRFWKWKCRVGRPRLPGNIRQLIVRRVGENPTWGEERVAAELSVEGTWAFSGGTGKFTGITGQGTYQGRMPSANEVEMSWEGRYELAVSTRAA
jgi:hypothetical protein